MRTVVVAVALLFATWPVAAVDFLGVEVCRGSTDTSVTLPPGSPLELEGVEIGSNGGLLMLLTTDSGRVMDQIDDLMTDLTGQRGTGGDETLEWSDGSLTAVAQLLAQRHAALAVSSPEPCGSAAATAEAASSPPTPDATSPIAASAASAAAADAVVDEIRPAPATAPPDHERLATPGPPPDYEVIGPISHERADATWVDVMGVVANHTATGYRLASFDLSLYDADGRLICVDTVSVSVLKAGQQRAFRDAIRCPGYDADDVARIELQFAGGL